MALQISETWQSGGNGTFGRDGQEEYSANVWGNPDPAVDNADNKLVIMAFALQHFTTLSPLGYVFSDVVPLRKGPGSWQVTCVYKTLENNRQTNDNSFSFTSGGGRTKIKNSIKTVGIYGAFSGNINWANVNTPWNPTQLPPPNFNGQINVSESGDVEGVDIATPSFNFKVTQYMSPASMNAEYLQQLKQTIPSVNSDVMNINVDGLNFEFQPGEILITSADGQKRIGFGDWELSLSFSQSNNLTNVLIGGITVGQINGWDYTWLYSNTATDGANYSDNVARHAIPQIVAVYVEQVYPYNPLTRIIHRSWQPIKLPL